MTIPTVLGAYSTVNSYVVHTLSVAWRAMYRFRACDNGLNFRDAPLAAMKAATTRVKPSVGDLWEQPQQDNNSNNGQHPDGLSPTLSSVYLSLLDASPVLVLLRAKVAVDVGPRHVVVQGRVVEEAVIVDHGATTPNGSPAAATMQRTATETTEEQHQQVNAAVVAHATSAAQCSAGQGKVSWHTGHDVKKRS